MRTQCPHVSIRIFWKLRFLFYVLAFRPQANGVFEQQKRRFLKTDGLEWIRGTKTEVYKHDYVIHHILLHYACLVLSWGKGENDSNMLLVKVYFFLKTEIKKISGYVWTGSESIGEKKNVSSFNLTFNLGWRSTIKITLYVCNITSNKFSPLFLRRAGLNTGIKLN